TKRLEEIRKRATMKPRAPPKAKLMSDSTTVQTRPCNRTWTCIHEKEVNISTGRSEVGAQPPLAGEDQQRQQVKQPAHGERQHEVDDEDDEEDLERAIGDRLDARGGGRQCLGGN